MVQQQGYCPECHKKDLDLLKKEHIIERAEDEKKGLVAEVEAANKRTEAAVKQAAEHKDEPQDFIPLPDIIQHCEDGSCPEHAKQLQEYRLKVAEDVVTNLTKKENRPKLLEIMKTAGIDEMPDKIVISGVEG